MDATQIISDPFLGHFLPQVSNRLAEDTVMGSRLLVLIPDVWRTSMENDFIKLHTKKFIDQICELGGTKEIMSNSVPLPVFKKHHLLSRSMSEWRYDSRNSILEWFVLLIDNSNCQYAKHGVIFRFQYDISHYVPHSKVSLTSIPICSPMPVSEINLNTNSIKCLMGSNTI